MGSRGASSGRSAGGTSGAKELDKNLIRRSNDQSFAYEAGNSINNEYKRNIKEIGKMNLPESEKKAAIQKQYELNSEALKAQSKYTSTYVSGPARRVKANDPKNLDKAASKRAKVKEHMDTLKEKSRKNAKAKEGKGMFDAMNQAIKDKQLTFTYGGKTYQRKTTRGKTFTLVE